MRIIRLLSNLNWKVYITELFIVILGISIAYQLNILYENKVNLRLELTAIQNLSKEIEINVAEFESLENYRKKISADSKRILELISSKDSFPLDSANKYIFKLVQTSTPDLQQEAANFYLNSNYSDSNLQLKNELLFLKTYFQEFTGLSEDAAERKQRGFFDLLWNDVDFQGFKVNDMKPINTLAFKNTIWTQVGDELELNRLFNLSYYKLKEIQKYIETLLIESK